MAKPSAKAALKAEVERLRQDLENVENYERWGGRPRDGWKDELKSKLDQARKKLAQLK